MIEMIDRKALEEGMRQLLSAELATVTDPANVEQHIALIALYQGMQLPKMAQSELNRLSLKYPKHPLVLASRISMAVEQKAVKLLAPLIKAAEGIPEQPIELQLAIARGYTTLLAYDKAAAQYGKMLSLDNLPDKAFEHLAEFICGQPYVESLTILLKTVAVLLDPASIRPCFRYVIFRVLVEDNYPKAREYLPNLRIEEFDNDDILFDIGVQAFRLGDWEKAIAACERVLARRPDHETARKLVCSAYAFAGNLDEAKKRLLEQSPLHTPLYVDGALRGAIEKFVKAQGRTGFAWAVVTYGRSAELFEILRKEREQLSEEIHIDAGNRQQGMTISIVGPNWSKTGPWDVLAEIDPTVPHLMVQRLDNKRIIHAFAATEGPSKWAWSEIPVLTTDNGSSTFSDEFCFMTGRIPSRESRGSGTGMLLCQIEEEMKSPRIRKEIRK